MRRRPLVVALYLGLAALVGIGSILTLAWREAGIDRRARFLYRLENGRCYRVRYVMNGALASTHYEAPASKCPSWDPQHPPEWQALADCHFVDCPPTSLTASITKNKQDFTSTLGYGPSEQDACENAKSRLRDFLRHDHCTPTTCTCFKVERVSSRASTDGASGPAARPWWLPGAR